jgi:sarcosine oxidase/L-pipecolate oxidase
MDFPGDEIPVEIDRELRAFLSQTLPELANRPWAWKRMFW